jgi:hypothetical protein
VHVFQLRHQPASEALALVLPLLSPLGVVEVRQAANTLVIRDQLSVLAKIGPLLRSFDHEARALQVAIWLVRAGRGPTVSPATPSTPPTLLPEVLHRLRSHLPYEHYELVAESSVAGKEGEQVTFDLSAEWQVRFRLGTVLAEQRIRLSQFEVARRRAAGEQTIMRSNINPWLDRPLVVALTSDEGSGNALLVVVECGLAAAGDSP